MTVARFLCALLVASHAPAGGVAWSYAGTRVMGHAHAEEAASGPARAPSPRTPWASPRTYGETASDRTKQYNGRVYDAGTGFHDYGARLYWPEIGRFVSADPVLGDPGVPASLNRYSYVHNNPYKYVDPSGKTPLVVAALAVAAAGGVGAAIGSYIDHGSVDWNQVGKWTSTGFLVGLTGGLSLAASGGVAATEVAATAAPAASGGAAPASTAATLSLGPGAAGVGQFVDKVVNSNMPHAAERAVERAGFGTAQEARAALQQFGAAIQRAGVLPDNAIRDSAHADRVIVPGFGQGGAVVYQVREGVLKLKTVLEWRPPNG